MINNTIEIKDYIEILRRRKTEILIPLITIFAISLGLAVGLPSIYRSTSTILIEQQEVPRDLVKSTVTSYAAERIQLISQRVMTRNNIIKIINRLNLLEPGKELDDEFILEVRENFSLQMVSADIINPQTGRQSRATIAFTLSYDNEDPRVAKNVAQEMTSLFLSENQKIREEKARTTSQFLAEESKRLGNLITELEGKLAEFKEENIGKLPELSNLNMTLMERTERELEEVERHIYSLRDRKMLLESRLTNVEPYTGQSPEVKLKQLISKYLSSSSIYTSEHPDLVRMKKEIEVLKKQTGVDDSDIIVEELAASKKQLDNALRKYREDHPDIIKMKRKVAMLEEKIQSLGGDLVLKQFTPKPDNPAYINLQTQIESIGINLKAASEKRDRLKVKMTEYEQRLTDAPRVEQAGLALRRDYNNAVKKYQEIKQKQLQAEVAEQLEKESKGERFSVLEPPRVPTLPIKPNRIGVFLLGTVLSFAGGFGYAAVKEVLDHTIRGSKSIIAITGGHPISVIPYKHITKRQKRPLVSKSSIIIGILIILAVIIGLVIVATI